MTNYTIKPHSKQTVDALWRLQKFIFDNLDFEDVVQRTVDSMLSELGYMKLGYRIVVLALIDKNKKNLKRIAISQTLEAQQALRATPIPFQEIKIPLSAKDNLCIKVLKSKKYAITDTWPDILTPPFSTEQAKGIQELIGIKESFVCPVTAKNKVLGIMIFSLIKPASQISAEEKDLILTFTEIVGLAVQNSRLYSDLSETKNHLVKANKKLKELDDLKDEFVSIASHELRTPMTAVKSYLWMALNQPEQPLKPTLKKYLDICYASTERLIHLVNDMLTVSRIERNKVEIKSEAMDVFEVLNAVYTELKVTADQNKIIFTLSRSDEKPFTINGDKEKLREVFQNIVGNALKFSSTGGSIKITINRKENMIAAAVADTGPGIPKDSMNMLFQKFGKIEYSYAKHSNQPGTGLGLYISKQIVTLHHGDIQVESEVNVGTTFTVLLPSISSEAK